jgi:phytoene synthase
LEDVAVSVDFDGLRQELRGLDGDLYLTHLFAPAAHRDALMTLYCAYADIARIPASVSEPMIGAIRLQWWRDVFDMVQQGQAGDSPIGAALLATQMRDTDFLNLIDGRESELDEAAFAAPAARAQTATTIGHAFMRLSLRLLGVKDDATLALGAEAGEGFELLRLTAANDGPQAAQAQAVLSSVVGRFNRLPRNKRKQALPAFLPIGLAAFQARHWPQQKSLLAYQWKILKMALLGRL